MRFKRALVTGGAGFIGSHLVEALVRRMPVTVFDNFSVGRRENVPPGVRVIEGDIQDRAAVRRTCRGHDLVFHLAVQCLRLSIVDPFLVHEVNATGTLNVAWACREQQVRRWVYCSSSEVYGTAVKRRMREDHPTEPTTPYGASKLAGEQYAKSFYRTYGLPVVVVRPFNSYGPREHFEGPYGEVIPKFVLRGLNGVSPVIFGDGGQTRDFMYVSDTARGILAAGLCDGLVGREVNLGTGRETSIRSLASQVLIAVGRRDLPVATAPERPGDVRRHCANIGRARRELGFRPCVPLQEGLRRYVRWVRETTTDARGALRMESSWEAGVPGMPGAGPR